MVESVESPSLYRMPAKIVGTRLGFVPDRGVFTATVSLDTGDGVCNFGDLTFNRDSSGALSRFVQGVLGAADVSSWEDLGGQVVYLLSGTPFDEGERWDVVGLDPMPFNGGRTFWLESVTRPQDATATGRHH